jgi:hypothetical protein
MLVQAKCLAQAWGPMAGTKQCAMYYPNRGPLPDGLYEIESGTALDNLTVPGTRGQWIFQYPGHEGKDPEFEAKEARARQKYQERLAWVVEKTVQPTVQTTVPTPERKHGNKGKKVSDAVKKKIRETRALKKAARLARLESEAA